MKTSSTTGSLVAIWFAAVCCLILGSPKWTFPPAAWIAPGLLLIVAQNLNTPRAMLVAFAAIFTGSLIANYNVVPFPLVFFVIVTLIGTITVLIPYLVHRLLYNRLTALPATLIFPCTFVVYEFVAAAGNGKGTWGSIAYTQISNSPLMQLASVTGVWGISFMIYWFASIMAYIVSQRFNWNTIRVPVTAFASITLIVLLYGTIRINPFFNAGKETVRVAGITASNLPLITSMYEDGFGKPGIDLEELLERGQLSITSPELQEMQKAFIPFIEDPNAGKFAKTRLLMNVFADSLFAQATREVRAGAEIISFSEALMFTDKENEPAFLQRGLDFAKANKVHLLLTAATILKGPVDGERKFMENKSWLIDPSGKVLNVFLKNRPVPIAEAGSVPGDGIVPVVSTSNGRIATSICYDADFPSLIRQAGQKQADILLLPSGDWREIAPYHAKMASVRSIENGFSMLRTVSGATSIACDYYGQVIASRNYYDRGAKVLVAYLPMQGVTTIYSKVGDVLVYICGAILLGIVAMVVFKKITTRNAIA